MPSRSVVRALVTMLALGLSLPAAAGPAAAQAVKVKMGSSLSPPAFDALTQYVAQDRGLFKKYGLEVEVVEFRGDATSTKALLAGEVDVNLMGSTASIVTASKGSKIRLWVVPQPVTPFYLVARKDAATTLQGLVGKNVAVSGIGAYSYHIPRMVLARSGIDPDKAKYIALGSPGDRFKALVAGKIDATVVRTIEAAKLAQYPEIVSLAQVSKVLPEIPDNFCMAKEEYIAKNPETMYKLTKAMIEANRWMAANKAGTIEVAARVLKDEPPEIFAKAYDMMDPREWGVNGDITEGQYKYTVDFLLQVGYLKEALPFDQFFDRRFLDRVLGELGRM
jgi:NitT/TauT family transport system substrate-binding protein